MTEQRRGWIVHAKAVALVAGGFLAAEDEFHSKVEMGAGDTETAPLTADAAGSTRHSLVDTRKSGRGCPRVARCSDAVGKAERAP